MFQSNGGPYYLVFEEKIVKLLLYMTPLWIPPP
jgi:hypothetical protein